MFQPRYEKGSIRMPSEITFMYSLLEWKRGTTHLFHAVGRFFCTKGLHVSYMWGVPHTGCWSDRCNKARCVAGAGGTHSIKLTQKRVLSIELAPQRFNVKEVKKIQAKCKPRNSSPNTKILLWLTKEPHWLTATCSYSQSKRREDCLYIHWAQPFNSTCLRLFITDFSL